MIFPSSKKNLSFTWDLTASEHRTSSQTPFSVLVRISTEISDATSDSTVLFTSLFVAGASTFSDCALSTEIPDAPSDSAGSSTFLFAGASAFLVAGTSATSVSSTNSASTGVPMEMLFEVPASSSAKKSSSWFAIPSGADSNSNSTVFSFEFGQYLCHGFLWSSVRFRLVVLRHQQFTSPVWTTVTAKTADLRLLLFSSGSPPETFRESSIASQTFGCKTSSDSSRFVHRKSSISSSFPKIVIVGPFSGHSPSLFSMVSAIVLDLVALWNLLSIVLNSPKLVAKKSNFPSSSAASGMPFFGIFFSFYLFSLCFVVFGFL